MHAIDDDGGDQVLLGREAAKDGASADAGAASDLAYADVEPVLGERRRGGVEE
jgi:hypothetical protein